MYKASNYDEQLFIELVASSFKGNPSVQAVIKQDNNQIKRLKALAKYVLKTAVPRDGVLISSDKTGFAVCYKYNAKKENLIDYWNQFLLVKNVIGLDRLFTVMKRDAYIKKIRPQSGEFLYFWFLGVIDKGRGRGAALELSKSIIQESKDKNLPIYLETSVLKNKRIYERYGFETYHEWDANNDGNPLWFMRKTND